jgi:hypothetical protein
MHRRSLAGGDGRSEVPLVIAAKNTSFATGGQPGHHSSGFSGGPPTPAHATIAITIPCQEDDLMKPIGQRVLMIYAGVLTAVFAATMLSGFAQAPGKMSLDELDVHRINVREPDGTLRLVISDAATAPGIFIKGKEYPHPNRRKAAGMTFYNDEGSENGGLIFGGEKDKDGTSESHGHLSFDAYEQDQTMALDSHQDKGGRYTKLQFNDYPDYSILEEIQLMASIRDLPQDQQALRMKDFLAKHGGPTRRMLLGRNTDGSVQLAMNDMQGHPRIMMKVDKDGTPSLQMLDSHGKVTGELVPRH